LKLAMERLMEANRVVNEVYERGSRRLARGS
jgi:hypothetical protein